MLRKEKQRALKLARQANGTVERVIAMIEEDTYCPEVIQQLDSVAGLLRTCKRELLTGHLNGCLEHKLKENKEKMIKELLKIYQLSS